MAQNSPHEEARFQFPRQECQVQVAWEDGAAPIGQVQQMEFPHVWQRAVPAHKLPFLAIPSRFLGSATWFRS